jgi:hypothetical protein
MGSVVDIATHYVLDDPGFVPWWGQEILSYTHLSRPAQGPIQPQLQ